jgi:peroxiredoxin
MLVIHPEECIDCGVCEAEFRVFEDLAKHHANERAAG